MVRTWRKGTLKHRWKHKLVYPLWKTVWQFLKKLKVDYHITQQLHSWIYIWIKQKYEFRKIHAPHCSSVQSLSHVRLLVTHGLQPTRLPCPSLSPRVCSDSCSLSWWCHPTRWLPNYWPRGGSKRTKLFQNFKQPHHDLQGREKQLFHTRTKGNTTLWYLLFTF